ncbi:serine threonine- kinase pim-2-like protein [Labeo rohita]|uniref:non-specific serine/threonine protein kinase n=1 Tax=Labeo rohita TaxID=84645 RepID=A0A498MEY2_LABRO|nr:serine threonine- kinase pim-2-like protein [Labeo rohita]
MCPTSVSVPEGGVHETEVAAWLNNISFCNGFCQWVDDEEWSIDSLPADSQQPVESNRASEAVNEQPSADKSPTEIPTQGNRRSRIHAFFKRAWKAVNKPFLRCRRMRVESPPPRQSDPDPEPEPVPGPSELQNEPDTDPAVPEPSVPDLPDYKPTTKSLSKLYKLQDLLGRESYGKVLKVIRKSDGQEVAIKNAEMEQPLYSSHCKLAKTKGYMFSCLKSGCSIHLPTEVALLLMLRRPPVCPYVIEMYEWSDRPLIFSLVLEFPQPCVSLRQFIRDSRGLTEPITRGFMRRALQFCPPEVYSRPKYYAVPTNVWGLDITLYMMVNMRPPFSSVREILQACIYTWKPDVSMACCDLIYQCLERSLVKRPTFEQILQHKWFESPE